MSLSSGQNLVLPAGLAARLDPVCDEFELAWLSGHRPQLEEFLPRVRPDDRPHLFAELLGLELEQRNRLGEQADASEYHCRLPEYRDVIDRAFGSGSTCQLKSPETPSESASGQPEIAACDELPRFAGRYEIQCEIARGGMGVILRVRDPDLKRALAVKLLRPEYRNNPDMARRFREEAQITGQLQHPCIPPIHEIGEIADGQPFFAMKLIKGKTLGELLDGKKPAADSLPRFLGIFEQVCQAVAFAHSRDIIHRDLKPSNVMVGAFGEVQVMDWGLAKVLGRAEESLPQDSVPGSVISTVRTRAPEWASRVGEVLGTPAYMSPEQARGETHVLDKRCDVFGLGAILCVILTGKPPFTGDSGVVVRQRAMTGDLVEAFDRLDACGADSDLVTLTQSCLAPRIGDRLPDAPAVADAVAAFLSGIQQKLWQTELERTAARLKAIEERKRHRLTASLAAIAIIAILIAGIGWKWIESVRTAERDRALDALYQELGRASALRDEANLVPLDTPEKRKKSARLWGGVTDIAEAVGQSLAGKPCGVGPEGQAHQRLGLLRTEANDAERDRAMMESLDNARDQRGELFAFEKAGVPHLAGAGEATPEAVANRFAEALRNYGIDVLTQDADQAANAIQGRTRIKSLLIAALDDWLAAETRGPAARRLIGVAQKVDADPFRNRLREALANRDGTALLQLAGEFSAADRSARTALLLADGLQQAGESGVAVALLRRVQSQHPEDFWVNATLGMSLAGLDATRREEAAGFLRAALAIRPDARFVEHNLNRIHPPLPEPILAPPPRPANRK